MAQPQTNGMMQMLDPFGIWKQTRDATLDMWSKTLIDMVQSDAYARSSGMLLDQILGPAQPVQDAVQKAMTYTLAYLNMPTRDEVMTLAERLINIETRLDDLDGKTSDMREEDRERALTLEDRLGKLEERIAANSGARESREPDRNLDRVLNTLMTRLDGLEAAIVASRAGSGAPEPPAETEPERKTPGRK